MIGLRNRYIVLGISLLVFGGCSSHTQSTTTFTESVPVPVVEEVRTAPGVVQYVWEEPMIDVVDVPPGLDPEGVYYRPAHQSIVEIRQGRWRYHRGQND